MNFIQKAGAKAGRGLMTAFVRMAFRPSIRYIDKKRHNCKFPEPVIFVGNHSSHMDGVMTSVIFSKARANIIVAKDWYEKPKYNWFLKYNRCIPMDRYNVETEWLRLSREAIKNGESVILYPEGRTGKEEEPREFKSGFIMLAMMSGAKIVPYAVEGKYKMFFGPRQKVLIGNPEELTAKDRKMTPAYMEAESERFRQLVIELQKKLKGDK